MIAKTEGSIDRRKMKRLVRKWMLSAGVRRATAYVPNPWHRFAQRNIMFEMRRELDART